MSETRDGDTPQTGLRFDNSYARLPAAFFARTPPRAPPDPQLVVFNARLGLELGLDASAHRPDQLARWFSGANPPPGAEPISQA